MRAVNAAPLSNSACQRVRAVLNDDAFALYQTMPPADQRHALDIYDGLRAQGFTARPLFQAALLHDVAKRELGLAYRTGVVLLNRITPLALARAANPNPKSWRYPFYVSLHHPELGAELAACAGVDERARDLIRTHQVDTCAFKGSDAAQLTEWHKALKALDDVS